MTKKALCSIPLNTPPYTLLLTAPFCFNLKVIQRFHENAPVVALAFHPNGTSVAALLKNGTIHLWQTDTGQIIASWGLEEDQAP